MSVDGETIDPPLDEEQFQKGDEEGVHHTDSEYDGIGVLHGRLHDGGIFDCGGSPLDYDVFTQMASEPRVSTVAVRMSLGTLSAPMLSTSLIVNKLSILCD